MRKIIPSLALLLTLTASTASADSIRITSGSLSGFSPTTTNGGTIELFGEGFQFVGSTGTGYVAASGPYIHGIAPGDTINLQAQWTGLDLGGHVTYNGLEARSGSVNHGPVNRYAEGGVGWAGTLTVPTFFSGGSVSAPFTFGGEFAIPDSATTFTRVTLTGSGTATLTLVPAPHLGAPGLFRFSSIVYEFENPAATPEPGSMLLLGTGLLGLVRRMRLKGAR